MKNNSEQERHCLTCGKTMRTSQKIPICRNCRNRGKQITLGTSGMLVVALSIVNKNLKNWVVYFIKLIDNEDEQTINSMEAEIEKMKNYTEQRVEEAKAESTTSESSEAVQGST